MLIPGLVSITFRKLTVEEIIDIAKNNKIPAIEWGGDIHVPHGDINKANQVKQLMDQANLKTYAYGSYFYVGNQDVHEFKPIIETAKALNAPAIRVWAGRQRSNDATDEQWNRIINDSIQIAKWAKAENIEIHFEFHDHTLTDTAESALKLMQAIKQPNVFLYWQPPVRMSIEDRLDGLKLVLPYIKNIHVFQWQERERLALEKGQKEWNLYLSHLPKDTTHYCAWSL